MRPGSKGLQMMERGAWVWIALVALVGAVVIASQPARADSWHLMLNDVSTASGTNCPESVTSAMDGTDHVFGNYFGNSGLSFTYRYGDNAPAIIVPTSGYSFFNGVYTFDFTTAWIAGWTLGDHFVIHPSTGTDFWCNLPYDSP